MVVVHCDNRRAVVAVNSGCSKISEITPTAVPVLYLRIEVRAVGWNNVFADVISRNILHPDPRGNHFSSNHLSGPALSPQYSLTLQLTLHIMSVSICLPTTKNP